MINTIFSKEKKTKFHWLNFFADKLVTTSPKESGFSQDLLDIISTGVSVNSSYSSNSVISAAEQLPVQTGNKTECALLGFVEKLGGNYKVIREANPEEHFAKVYTFNSSRKSMTTVIKTPNGWRLFSKGAAEILLDR